MYSYLSKLLSDKEGGVTFSCFDVYHLIYIAIFLILLVLSLLIARKKPETVRKRIERVFIGIAFGLYIADFFLMPFAYGEIDIDKLPFHACTSMCIMCFLSNYVPALKKYKTNLAVLGFISNLTYLVYPAGIMWHEIHPFCYRALQTISFHGFMVIYGLLVIINDKENNRFKTCYRDLSILGILTVWAILGNALYSGTAGDYDHHFNWFFVREDPLGILVGNPNAQYIAPWLNIVALFSLELIVYGICFATKKAFSSKKEANLTTV